MLLLVPAYYVGVQSSLHTEYRYVLAIHYFLFIIAAVTLYIAGRLMAQGAQQAFVILKNRLSVCSGDNELSAGARYNGRVEEKSSQEGQPDGRGQL